jgi:hypothetical protein
MTQPPQNRFLVESLIGAADGVAGLDADGKVPDAQLPPAAQAAALALKAPIASPTFTGTVGGVTKAMVGLGNADNTTDAGKPVSTAQAAAIALKLNSTDAAATYAPLSQKAAANGLATLGADSKIPAGQIPLGTANGAASLDASGKVPAAQIPDQAGRTVYVESFRDGIRTDNQILTAAFAALTAGGSLKFGQGKTYVVTTASSYDLTSKPNAFIDGQGATIDGAAVASGMILKLTGGAGSVATSLASAIPARTKTITVTSTAGFAAGDMLKIRSNTEIFNPDRTTAVKQEMARVAAVVDGTTLTLETFTWNTYSITGYTVTVTKVPAVRNLRISDLTVKGAGGGSNQTGLQITNFDGVRLNNITVDGAGVEGLAGATGLDWIATNCRAQFANASGVGYGFHVTEAQHVKFIGCYGRANRHSFDVDEARDVIYQGCSAVGDTSAGISTHGSTDTVKFLGNTVKDCGGGLVSRGKNTLIIGNTVTGSRTIADTAESYVHGITLGDNNASYGQGLAGIGLLIRDNDIDISGPDWTGASSFGIFSTGLLRDAEISGNRISGFSSHGIHSKGDSGLRVYINDNRIDSSGQLGTSGVTAAHGIFLSPTHAAAGNTYNQVEIKGNKISGALYDGVRIKGNPDNTGPVSDNLVITGNEVGPCGVTRVSVSDGYFGYRIEIWGNEWLGIAATATAVSIAAAANYLAMPFVGANGWGTKGVRPLAVGQEIGARLRGGIYYTSVGTNGAAAVTQSRLSAVPFFVNRTVTIDKLAVNVTTAGAAASTVALGIYEDVRDNQGGYPGALVAGSTGSVAADTTGFKEASISAALTPGLYWLCAAAQGGTPSLTVLTNGNNQIVGYQAAGTATGRAGWVQDGVTGALPATFTTSANAQGNPALVHAHVV